MSQRRDATIHHRGWRQTFGAALVALGLSSLAAAETVEFQHGSNDYLGGRDATIFSGPWVNHSSGGSRWLFLGTSDATEARRGLIRFLLPPWLSERQVVSAELVLWVDSINEEAEGEVSYRVHRLFQSWGEGTSDSDNMGLDRGVPASAGEVTWVSREHPASAWTSPGGHFLLLDSGSDTIPVTGSVLRITGPRMADDVNIWLRSPEANHGWLIVGDETRLFTDVRVRSTEFLDVEAPDQGLSTRPMLRLVLADTSTPVPTATATPTPTPTPVVGGGRLVVVDILVGERASESEQDRNRDQRIDAADLIAAGV